MTDITPSTPEDPYETEDLMRLEQMPLGSTHDIAEAMEACLRARGFAQTIHNLVRADRAEAAANVAGVLQQLDKAITCLGMLGGDPQLTRF